MTPAFAGMFRFNTTATLEDCSTDGKHCYVMGANNLYLIHGDLFLIHGELLIYRTL